MQAEEGSKDKTTSSMPSLKSEIMKNYDLIKLEEVMHQNVFLSQSSEHVYSGLIIREHSVMSTIR